MTTGISKDRSVSSSSSMEKPSQKYRSKMYKEDLDIFVSKYKKESKILNFIRGLPPEISMIKNISDRYDSLSSQRTPIADEDKEIIYNLIALNKEQRDEKSDATLRLRDQIIDRMSIFFELDKNRTGKTQYFSFDDFI